jgi:hypothetical protein
MRLQAQEASLQAQLAEALSAAEVRAVRRRRAWAGMPLCAHVQPLLSLQTNPAHAHQPPQVATGDQCRLARQVQALANKLAAKEDAGAASSGSLHGTRCVSEVRACVTASLAGCAGHTPHAAAPPPPPPATWPRLTMRAPPTHPFTNRTGRRAELSARTRRPPAHRQQQQQQWLCCPAGLLRCHGCPAAHRPGACVGGASGGHAAPRHQHQQQRQHAQHG